MVSKKELTRREEQVVEFLRKGLANTQLTSKLIKIDGEKMLYLVVEGSPQKEILIPIYIHIPNQEKRLEDLCHRVQDSSLNPAFLFYKDGENFFRNAAEKNYFKKEYGLSLKDYSSDEIKRMILLSKEELYVKSRKGESLQYYQPKSERMEERLVSVEFLTVTYDYSHVESDRFQPENRESERIFIWDKDTRDESIGPFVVKSGYIRHRKANPIQQFFGPSF